MRQSVAPNRVSQISSPQLYCCACEASRKEKGISAVSALEKASALYLERIEGLGKTAILWQMQEKVGLSLKWILSVDFLQFMVRSWRNGQRCSRF
jgi:hypothetical protein